jgi:plastocyanin
VTTRAIPLLLAVLVAGGTTACAAVRADDTVVRMRAEMRFDPAVVEVPLGATVTWENDGSRAHTVTELGEEGEDRPDGFDSSEVPGTGRFSHTFDEPGEYLYRCRIHGDRGMVGLVVVTS